MQNSESAQSRADFVSKLEIALKEARETRYWLDLLIASGLVEGSRLKQLRAEAEGLIKIIVTITRNSKQGPRRPAQADASQAILLKHQKV